MQKKKKKKKKIKEIQKILASKTSLKFDERRLKFKTHLSNYQTVSLK